MYPKALAGLFACRHGTAAWGDGLEEFCRWLVAVHGVHAVRQALQRFKNMRTHNY